MRTGPDLRQCVRKQFTAPSLSAASLWCWCSRVLTLVLTVLILFESQGMWRKENTYLEKPRVTLDKNCMLVLSDGAADPFSYYFWSPFKDLNKAQEDRLLTPTVSVRTEESDSVDTVRRPESDHFAAQIFLDASLTLPANFSAVRSLTWLLFYSAQLSRRAVVQAEGVLGGQVQNMASGRAYSLFADLALRQSSALPARGRFEYRQAWAELNDSLLLLDSALLLPFELRKRAMAGPLTLFVARQADFWDGGQPAGQFNISFQFNVFEQPLLYRTGALELLKWFWVQAFPVFALVNCVFRKITVFLIENNVLGTTVKRNDAQKKLD